ncbi:MAG: DUF4406 domain-containing protein [Spirochaetaceae bacterium]|jgi:hypothetical protein|nr:DUF4406 domain-containing protein [Spirochaetaceae bacterium]
MIITVYISGAITGIPNRNKNGFRDAWRDISELKKFRELRDMKIINPLHIGRRLEKSFTARGWGEPKWSDYMRVCVKKLMDADCAYFLEDWTRSEGASVERYVAKRLNIPCVDNITELKNVLKNILEVKKQ